MFNQKYFPYVRAVSEIMSRRNYGSTTMRSIVAMAVATAVARSLPLPSSAVENAAKYYADTQMLAVRDRLAAYNEEACLHYEMACDFAKNLWLQREWNANARSLPIHHGLDFFETVSGAGVFFSKTELEEAKKYSEDILRLAIICGEIEAAVQAAAIEQSLPADSVPSPV